jgi:MarR family transcriptional regulator for hemolysin
MALDYDIDESLGYWIVTTSIAMQGALRRELAPLGVTDRQFTVLFWLGKDPDITQVELAERMGVDPSTVAGVLLRMERDGLIEREVRTKDRRCKRIRPTPSAVALWPKLAERGLALRRLASANLSAADIDTLARILGQVRANIGQPPHARVADALPHAEGA